ncbi:hypothetical protein thsps117_41460 [Pseudomonas sp. No.117]
MQVGILAHVPGSLSQRRNGSAIGQTNGLSGIHGRILLVGVRDWSASATSILPAIRPTAARGLPQALRPDVALVKYDYKETNKNVSKELS